MIRHGVSRDLAALLLADIKAAIEHFKTFPVEHSGASRTFKPLAGMESWIIIQYLDKYSIG